jgi:hypothetical protein
VSSVTGTLLTISHERAAEFRSRMLLAAEDLLRRGETVRRFARRPHRTDDNEPIDRMLDAWDEFASAVALVELLFGHSSEAAYWAREAGNELRDVEQGIRASLGASELVTVLHEDTIREHMLKSGEAMNKFGEVAAAQIRQTRLVGGLHMRQRGVIIKPFGPSGC